MAALLHDVVDDTRVGLAEVRRAFGPRIAGIVGQVGRLSTTAQLLRRRRRTHVRPPAECGVEPPESGFWGGRHSILLLAGRSTHA